MTLDEKITAFKTMLGSEYEDEDDEVVTTYLNMSRQRILNHRFPYGTARVEVEPQFEYLEIELAIVLYNQRGAEGQDKHSENGVSRTWRTPNEILRDIPRRGGIPQ